jgi:outer membrane protein
MRPYGFRAMVILLALTWLALSAAALTGNSTTARNARSLTLDEALASALKLNKTYQMQLQKQEQARAAWVQALLGAGPTASLQAGYVFDNRPVTTVFDFGSGPPMELQMSTNYYSGRVFITQPIFTGFKLWNALDIAKSTKQIAEDQTVLTRTHVIQDVKLAFHRIMILERAIQVMEASLDAARKHLAVIKARYAQGESSNYELLRTQVGVDNLQPTLLKLRDQKRLAMAGLATLIGWDNQQEIRCQGELQITLEPVQPLEELIRQALTSRIERKNLEQSKKIAEANHSLALWSNLPNVALNATWTYYDTQDQDTWPQANNLDHAWEVGIGLNWPFWDNLAVLPKTSAAAAKIRESDLSLAAFEDAIRIEVESAWLTLRTSAETIQVQEKTTALAEEGYRIAEKQFQNGLLTNLDVIDSQIAWNQAQTNYLQAQFDYLSAQVMMRRAIGESE